MPKHSQVLPSLVLIGFLPCVWSCALSSSQGVQVAVGKEIPPSSAPPQVSTVIDLGSVKLVDSARLPLRSSDGVAVIGELIFISGKHFGRRLKVWVSGIIAQQVARTTDGGVVVRIPWGAQTGRQPILVKNPQGESRTTFTIRRYALATVPSRDRIYVLSVQPHGATLHGEPLELSNAHLIRYCADGQIAYVSGQNIREELTITTLDMAAPGHPRMVGDQTLPGTRVIALTAAERAPLALALSDSHFMFFQIEDPRSPARYTPQPLPANLKGQLVAADMNPQGTLLAVLIRNKNQVLLYDVTRYQLTSPMASAQVLPEAEAPLLQDLRFAGDSKTLWVVSGDNPRSYGLGRFPPRLTGIRIQAENRGNTKRYGILSVWRTLDVPHQAAPVALTVARGQPLASGGTVRIPPNNAAIFLTVHDSKLLKLTHTRFDRRAGLRRAVGILRGISPLGSLVKTDINGQGGMLFSSASLFGALDITSDSQLLLMAGAQLEINRRPAAVKLIYGVTTSRVFGMFEPAFIELAKVDPEHLARPFLLGDVRIQP